MKKRIFTLVALLLMSAALLGQTWHTPDETIQTVGSPYQAWVDVQKYASFALAVAAADSDLRTLLIPTVQNVTADITIPSNVTLHFVREGRLNVSAGTTVTINGRIEAPPQQIFSTTGNILFAAGSVREIYTEWYGAKGDNSTDSTLAFARTMASYATITMKIPIKLLTGTYLIDYWVLRPYVQVIASGITNTKIKRRTSSTSGHFITLLPGEISTNGMKLSDFTVDGNSVGTGLDGINFAGSGQNFSQWSVIDSVYVTGATGWGFRLHVNVSKIRNTWAMTNAGGGYYITGGELIGLSVNAEGNAGNDFKCMAIGTTIVGLQLESGTLTDEENEVVHINNGGITLIGVQANYSGHTKPNLIKTGASATDFMAVNVLNGGGTWTNFIYDGAMSPAQSIAAPSTNYAIGLYHSGHSGSTSYIFTGTLRLQANVSLLNNGSGVIMTNAAGSVTKKVRLNDAGDGLIFDTP